MVGPVGGTSLVWCLGLRVCKASDASFTGNPLGIENLVVTFDVGVQPCVLGQLQ